MACNLPAHVDILERLSRLEAGVSEVAPLKAEVARLKAKELKTTLLVTRQNAEITRQNAEMTRQKTEVTRQKTEATRLNADVSRLKSEVAPLNAAHLHLCARSFLEAELLIVSKHTGMPIDRLKAWPYYFSGVSQAARWADEHHHPKITRKAVEAARQEMLLFASDAARGRIRHVAKGDAHPNLAGCDKKRMLDIISAFPVTVSYVNDSGTIVTETATAEDAHSVARLFLHAIGQHELLSSITPRASAVSSAGSGAAAAAAAAISAPPAAQAASRRINRQAQAARASPAIAAFLPGVIPMAAAGGPTVPHPDIGADSARARWRDVTFGPGSASS